MDTDSDSSSWGSHGFGMETQESDSDGTHEEEIICCELEEFLDHDLSDSEIEDDEVDHLEEEVGLMSPFKRPARGTTLAHGEVFVHAVQEPDDPVMAARNLLPDFESSPKRKKTSSNSNRVSFINCAMEEGKIIWVSFDIETGGQDCGIIQMSAVFLDSKFNELGCFDTHVRPQLGARFDQAAVAVHGIGSRDDHRLKNAPSLEDAWIRFRTQCHHIFN